MKRQKILFIVLIVLLVLAIGYIVLNEVQENKIQRQNEMIQLGARQAVNQIVQQTSQCQTVKLSSQNKTVNIASMECIQKQLQQKNLNNKITPK